MGGDAAASIYSVKPRLRASLSNLLELAGAALFLYAVWVMAPILALCLAGILLTLIGYIFGPR